MTLYSADVLDLAKPVPKKGKGKKESQPEPESEPKQIEPAPVKEKKTPSEKQLAALAKAQESRKRKREEAEAAKVAAENAEKARIAAEEEKKKALEAKKEAAREKRRAKKQLPSPAESMDEEIDRAVEAIAPPKKKTKTVPKATVDESGPPAWFKQYVAGVKKEEAKISHEKKPKKQIQQESEDIAQKNWSDSFTRDRVRNEVDGHMSRMYQMMFAGRRLK